MQAKTLNQFLALGMSSRVQKIHRSTFRSKIFLLYFYDAYNVNLREKKFGVIIAFSWKANVYIEFYYRISILEFLLHTWNVTWSVSKRFKPRFDNSVIHLFKRVKHWNLDITDYWLIRAGCWNEKKLELSSSPPYFSKIPESLVIQWVVV